MLYFMRRLGNYNLTIYNFQIKACHCFTWHEGQGNRGSSEIGTYLSIYLDQLDAAGVKTVKLFADGCPGQIKIL